MEKLSKTPKPEAPPAPDTVELKGDNVENVVDYTHLLKVQEDAQRITHKDGRPAKEAFPDWHYAWVKNGADGRPDKINIRLTQLYVVVTNKTDPDLIVPAVGAASQKKNGGKFVYNELTLMKLPMEYKKQRDTYLKEENKRRMAAIEKDYDSAVEGAYGEVNTRRGER